MTFRARERLVTLDPDVAITIYTWNHSILDSLRRIATHALCCIRVQTAQGQAFVESIRVAACVAMRRRESRIE